MKERAIFKIGLLVLILVLGFGYLAYLFYPKWKEERELMLGKRYLELKAHKIPMSAEQFEKARKAEKAKILNNQ